MKRLLVGPCLVLVCACHTNGAPLTDGDVLQVEAGMSDAAKDSGALPDDDAPRPSLVELLDLYRAWRPRQAAPQSISAEIFGLCRLPSLPEQRFAASEHGDGRYLQDWLNPSARDAFQTKTTPFPVGAAIVKEKLSTDAAGKLVLAARGLMIKRATGFDPAHGDWEFGYWEPATGMSSGEQTARHCGGCHASAPNDFVFLDQSWRQP